MNLKYYNLIVPQSQDDKNVLGNKEEESHEFQEKIVPHYPVIKFQPLRS